MDTLVFKDSMKSARGGRSRNNLYIHGSEQLGHFLQTPSWNTSILHTMWICQDNKEV